MSLSKDYFIRSRELLDVFTTVKRRLIFSSERTVLKKGGEIGRQLKLNVLSEMRRGKSSDKIFRQEEALI